MKTKIDFITELLGNKKLHTSQKERLFSLVAEDLNGDKEEIKKIWEEIDKIKEIDNKNESIVQEKKQTTLVINDDKGIKTSTIPNPQKTIKNHSPKTMVKFLYSFSIDERFKWFTHSPDGLITEFNYKTYVNNANIEYNATTGWNINNVTYHNVRNFIFNTKSKTNLYGRGNINFSWRDVEKWCDEHPNTHPYNAVLNGDSFKKYINQFKQIIEFRTDDPDLTFNIRVRKLIRDLLGVDFNSHFSVSFNEIGQSLKIFCDVNLLFNAIKQIIEWILENKAKSNEVEVNLLDSDEYYQLEIIHKNSYLSISSNDEKLNGLSGDFDKTRKMLFSIADWVIFTTIKNNNLTEDYKIICLDTDTELIDNALTPNIIEKANVNCNGIKHILKLYKTQDL
jgi:hypothetical protein